MSKPGGDPSSGISLGDVLRRPRRHPACRRREARPGFRMERENLFSDAKGQATSGSNREGESTEAGRRDGAARSSDEGSVMGLERGGCVVQPRLSSQNEDPSVTRQGLSAASPHTASPCGQDYRLPGSGRSASSLRASRRLISEVNEPTRRSWHEGSLYFPTAVLTHHRARNFTNCAPVVDVRDIQTAP